MAEQFQNGEPTENLSAEGFDASASACAAGLSISEAKTLRSLPIRDLSEILIAMSIDKDGETHAEIEKRAAIKSLAKKMIREKSIPIQSTHETAGFEPY